MKTYIITEEQLETISAEVGILTDIVYDIQDNGAIYPNNTVNESKEKVEDIVKVITKRPTEKS